MKELSITIYSNYRISGIQPGVAKCRSGGVREVMLFFESSKQPNNCTKDVLQVFERKCDAAVTLR